MIVNKQSIQLIEKSTEKSYFVVNSSFAHLSFFLYKERTKVQDIAVQSAW